MRKAGATKVFFLHSFSMMRGILSMCTISKGLQSAPPSGKLILHSHNTYTHRNEQGKAEGDGRKKFIALSNLAWRNLHKIVVKCRFFLLREGEWIIFETTVKTTGERCEVETNFSRVFCDKKASHNADEKKWKLFPRKVFLSLERKRKVWVKAFPVLYARWNCKKCHEGGANEFIT